MATKGDKVYLKAKPQFYQPAGEAITGFYRNGAVPGDTIVNDWITDNYSDCVFLGETMEVGGNMYYFVRMSFTYRKHGFLGIATTEKSSEDLWFLELDISFEYIQTKEELAEAEKKAAQDKLLSDVDKTLAGSGEPETKSNNTILIVAIVGALGVLGGVLWWAFGKKKGEAPAAAQQPTIIQLPKSK